MSVIVRAAYRSILRQCHNLSKIYPDPDDLCFAVFGIVAGRSDFAAGGYGSTPAAITRSCFDRPSVPGDAADTAPARIAGAFDMIRRLHATQEKARGHLFAAHRRQWNADEPDEEAKAPITPPTKEEGPKDHKGTEKSGKEQLPPKEEDATLCHGTFLIQKSQQQRSQKFYRHTIVTKRHTTFPPYPLLLPPEPMYPRNIREETRHPLIRDILRCLGAQAAATQGDATHSHSRIKVLPRVPSSKKDGGRKLDPPAATPDDPACRLSQEEWTKHLPTTSLTLTDFVEVELVTRYVCGQAAEETAEEPSDTAAGVSNVFLYYVFIRNLGAPRNSKGWHIQILSQHLVVLDADEGTIIEMARPGVGGNFPALRPGESHAYEGGTRIKSAEGVLRGTLQVNAFSEDGKTRSFDVHLSPTRLSLTATASLKETKKAEGDMQDGRRDTSTPRTPSTAVDCPF